MCPCGLAISATISLFALVQSPDALSPAALPDHRSFEFPFFGEKQPGFQNPGMRFSGIPHSIPGRKRRIGQEGNRGERIENAIKFWYFGFRKCFRYRAMNKGHLLQIIKEILRADGRTVFAYAYGSFITGETFHDIDIGIFVKNSGENPLVISSDIKTQISRRAQKEGLELTADEFDVRTLNDAPFTFLKRVFQEGNLLFDLDPELRTDIIEWVSRKYRECAGILAEASLR